MVVSSVLCLPIINLFFLSLNLKNERPVSFLLRHHTKMPNGQVRHLRQRSMRSFFFVSSINFQGENVKLNFMNYDFTNGMFSDSANGMLSDSAKINFAKIPAVRSSGDFTKGEDISNSFLFCLILV